MIRPDDSIIVQRVSRFLIPFIHVFAIYVLIHGHYSPGGGFQAGVLIGAAVILKLLVGTQRELQKYSIGQEFSGAILGLLIYAGIGLAAILAGSNFLDYGVLSFLAPETDMRRYYGILGIEIGVTLAVSMTLVIIFHALALYDDKEWNAS